MTSKVASMSAVKRLWLGDEVLRESVGVESEDKLILGAVERSKDMRMRPVMRVSIMVVNVVATMHPQHAKHFLRA